ncbi:dihydrolipoamide dehydrogenase [Agaricicola taiwanensis]|uniref:Dihydrolipoamide dehydrogenase n=1 Tax=Agaricicola taiwanensis TaxID=591372 RepID=A0A8J2YG96_9RHOB|nr:dihydrolipoamide dehydrogenase [Agaricicola taiwanensis]
MTPDVCIIGGGAAGTTAALALAAMNIPTVLVERGEVGRGAQAQTEHAAFLAAAARAHVVRTARRFGISSSAPKVDWPAVRAHVAQAAEALAPNTSAARLTALGVQVIAADASFVDHRTVQAGSHTIRARRFILATGVRALLPPVPGLSETPHLTLDCVMTLEEMPKRLLILGQGPRSIELAQAFAQLGSRVAIVGASPLADLAVEWREPILASCRRDGVMFHEAAVASVRLEKSGIKAELADGTQLTAGHLLVEAETSQEIEALRLDLAGVRHDDRTIEVDQRLRTSNRRVFAIGSTAGNPAAEAADAAIVIRNIIFRQPARRTDEHLPYLIATDPPYASVGLDEEAAHRRAGVIRIFRWPYHDNARAQAEASTSGHIRIVTDARTRVLGVSIVGHGAGELIHTWAAAVKHRRSLAEVADVLATYPAFSDLGRQAAAVLQVEHLTNPRVQRIIRFLRLG